MPMITRAFTCQRDIRRRSIRATSRDARSRSGRIPAARSPVSIGGRIARWEFQCQCKALSQNQSKDGGSVYTERVPQTFAMITTHYLPPLPLDDYPGSYLIQCRKVAT